MVPIHDTDLAEERWKEKEWHQYELWEDVEQRLRKIKRIWIFATLVLFILLSSIPIIIDRSPKWGAYSSIRELSQQINTMKREAAAQHSTFRLKFINFETLTYQIEKVLDCSKKSGVVVFLGSLSNGNHRYLLLNEEQGLKLGIPGLTTGFCYDPQLGSESGDTFVGFGVIPVKDLAKTRTDRISILILNGPSAEISFD